MKRFTFLLAALGLLTVGACERNIGKLPEATPEYSELYFAGTITAAAVPPQGVLYVGASPVGGNNATLIARYDNPVWPVQFEISDLNGVSHQGGGISEKMVLLARFDQDGDLNTHSPGDLVYKAAEIYDLGSKGIKLFMESDEATAPAPTGRLSLKGIIRGTLPPVQGSLFISAKMVGNPMPVASIRIDNPQLPLQFHLTDQNLIVPEAPLPDQVEFSVRFDTDGNIMTRGEGDIEKLAYPGPVVRDQLVEIVLP